MTKTQRQRKNHRTRKRQRGGGEEDGYWDTFKSKLTGALGTAKSWVPQWKAQVSGNCTAADGKLVIIERKIKSIQEELTAARDIIRQAKESTEAAPVAAGPEAAPVAAGPEAAPVAAGPEPVAQGAAIEPVPIQGGGRRRRRRKRTRKQRRKRTIRRHRKKRRRTRR